MTGLTIRPLNTGYVTMIPQQYLYHFSTLKYQKKAISDQEEEFPVFSFLVEGGDKLLLIDTGMAWTERADHYHHHGSRQPSGMAIHERLAGIGYKPEDVDVIVFTHLHWDHCYYMDLFKNAVLIVHRRELEFALDPIPIYYNSYEHPSLGIVRPFEGAQFAAIEGEREIMPGVRAFETPGHSPGHMSVEIDTKKGKYICAGDSVFIPENLDPIPELRYDITPPGRYADIVATWDSIVRQKARAKDKDLILCSHDRSLEQIVARTPVLGF
jgi:N-acyl homoserine lactone hydrolase